jgi:hypothetical protein
MKHTPQLEDGYVRISSEFLEEFIPADYPGSVKEFVLVIIRETWGWNETWRAIPLARIADTMRVSQARAKQLRDEAVAYNLVEWVPGRGHGHHGEYRVQKDYKDWIPRRRTGAWAARHSGKDALSGNDALSGKDVLPTTGKDVLPDNRQGRTTHLIDSYRHSINNASNQGGSSTSAGSPLDTTSGGDITTATGTSISDDPADADHMAACNEPELVAAATKYFANSLSPQRATAWAMDALRLTLLPGETLTRDDLVAALGNGSGPKGQETKFPDKWLDRIRARASPPGGRAGWDLPTSYPEGEFKL